MGQDNAQTMGLQALAWLASDEDLIGPFLAQSGIALGELRVRAGDPDLLASVFDFILAEDKLVLALAQALGIAPEKLLAARAMLPGGDVPHWT